MDDEALGTTICTMKPLDVAGLEALAGGIGQSRLTRITVSVIVLVQRCRSAPVIRSFYDQRTEDIFNRRRTKAARRTCPEQARRTAERKLDQLNAAVSLGSLRIPPGNHLEALGKDRPGQHSIRINDQYRICFVWTDDGPSRVEVTDYH